MKVLMISGDRSFKEGHSRYELHRESVDELAVVYWGKGRVWPKVPSGEFDVVTVQDPFWRGLFAWNIARRMRAKFNVQVHTDLSAHSLMRRILSQIVLRHARSVRVVSEKIKRQVLNMGVKAPIQVLPIFVDINQFAAVVRKKHTGKNILWIGRFEEEKNPLEAIAVLKKVLIQIPESQLIMLGEGTMKEETIREANNSPIIQILGWQNPRNYLDTADVVLCTSWHESWGASIVEALAAGVPVVAPDIGIAREAGAIVVPRNELADAAIRVLKEGAQGVLKFEPLSRSQYVEQLQALYSL